MVTYWMRKSLVLQWTLVVLIAVVLATPSAVAGEMTFKSIVVFGDSLSDPGNDFALINAQNTPPYDNIEYLDGLIIPHVPYAKGGHHYSNGATWVEQFAKPQRLAQYVTPAWQSKGTKAANYAVGGARAYNDGINKNLSDQVNKYLADVGYPAYPASSDALYVIEVGGNDIRDALMAFLAGGGDLGTIIDNIFNKMSLPSIEANIKSLHGAGARKILVWNAPNLGLTPAILALDSMYPGTATVTGILVSAFNNGLGTLLGTLSGLPGIEIKFFNVYDKVNELVLQPGDYGLEVVNAACVTPNSPPFDCKEPDEYLFWDGIHPTKTAHGIFAQEVAALLSQ